MTNMRYAACLLLALFLAGCGSSGPTDEGERDSPDPMDTYTVTFQSAWSAATHPTDFPSDPHFSGLIGATHRAGVILWAEGGLASPGIENMAETGSKDPLNSEIDTLIQRGQAGVKLSGSGIRPSPGSVSHTFFGGPGGQVHSALQEFP